MPIEVRLRMTNKTLHDVVFLNNHCYNLVLKDHNGKAIPNHRGSGWSESPPPPVIIGPGRGFAVLCDARLRWNHRDDAAAMSCLGKTGFWSVYSPLKAGKHSLSVHVCTIANKGWPLPKPPELAAWRYDVTASMSIPPGAEVTATPAVTFEIVAP